MLTSPVNQSLANLSLVHVTIKGGEEGEVCGAELLLYWGQQINSVFYLVISKHEATFCKLSHYWPAVVDQCSMWVWFNICIRNQKNNWAWKNAFNYLPINREGKRKNKKENLKSRITNSDFLGAWMCHFMAVPCCSHPREILSLLVVFYADSFGLNVK